MAVLWYTPGIRFSNSDPTTTTLFAFAAAASRSDDGPGIGSARSNRAASSCWQKYGPRNSSGRQTTCAPCLAASAMAASAFARFVGASGAHPHLHEGDGERVGHCRSSVAFVVRGPIADRASTLLA